MELFFAGIITIMFLGFFACSCARLAWGLIKVGFAVALMLFVMTMVMCS